MTQPIRSSSRASSWRRARIAVAFAGLALGAAACDMDLDLTDPNSPTEETALSSLDGIVATSLGMQDQFAGAVLTYVRAPALITDEWGPASRALASDQVLFTGEAIDPSFGTVSGPYFATYRIVRTAEAVWRAEFGAEPTPAAEVERPRITTEALQALRDGGAADWKDVAAELRAHGRALHRLGLSAASLRVDVTASQALRWALSKLWLLPLLPISALGGLFFWLPKRLTVAGAAYTARLEGDDTVVTHRVLVGGVVFPLWIAVTSLLIDLQFGWALGLVSALLQPFWAFAALAVGERRQAMWTAVRRYFLRRFNAQRRWGALRGDQRGVSDRRVEAHLEGRFRREALRAGDKAHAGRHLGLFPRAREREEAEGDQEESQQQVPGTGRPPLGNGPDDGVARLDGT